MTAHDRVAALVRHYYWDRDMNCARTTLRCLESLTGQKVHPQLYQAVVGCHGAGGTGGQCGLVEGGLLFLGIYGAALGLSEDATVDACAAYARQFAERFGSLSCSDLRPDGFHKQDPPHVCEILSVDAICFLHNYVRGLTGQPPVE